MTAFPLRMALRETRAAWRHFLYFFVCIALGVGALVSVSLFAANVEQAVTKEARGLLGGDIEVRLSRALSPQGLAVLRSLENRGITTIHVSELVGMASARHPPASPTGLSTQLIELKAVETGYPYYGVVKVEPPYPLADLLAPRAGQVPDQPVHGAVVQESLLIRMGLSVGNRLRIGQAEFVIMGVLRKEPDRVASLFSLGPRVMISQQGLAASELIKPGSRVRERYLLRVPGSADPDHLLYELRGRLAGERARVMAYQDAQPQLRRFMDQLTRYLGLIGLTALFVGGIGVATTVQAFLREKLNTIAILKTLGADSPFVIQTYLVQTLLFGLIGSLTGAILGVGLQGALPALLSRLFPLDLVSLPIQPTGLAFLPILKGITMGVLTTILFTLWPLLRVREIRPALIFRREVDSPEPAQSPGLSPADQPSEDGWVRTCQRTWRRWVGPTDRLTWMTAAGIAAGLALLAVWEARSVTIGLLFLGALAAAVILLQSAAFLLVRALARVSAKGKGSGLGSTMASSLAVRQGLANVYRPGSQATGILVSVGIGVMVIVTVALIERSLVQQLRQSRPVDSPTFFFIDLQPDQKDAFHRLVLERLPESRPELTPLVRSRLHAINGQRIIPDELRDQEEEQGRGGRKTWYYTRDYVLTFLDDVPKDNVITKGAWWDDPATTRRIKAGETLVSVEEDAANNLGLDLGSMVELDIQGSTVKAEVASLRRVDWGNLSTNFYMILSPGSLEGAPITYVATVQVSSQDEVPLQQAVVAAFPNVTAINIGDVLATFTRILERLSLAIQAVALFCILAGGIVMAAALATTRYRRLYESVLFKALGATRGLIARSFATEYAVLGFVAGCLGLVLASTLSWIFLHFFLDLNWTLQPGMLLLALALTVLLTLTVGFLTTFGILGQRPLAVLRHE